MFLEGKTKSGFKFSISKEQLENYELLEALSELEDDAMALPRVIKLLLGDDGAKRLKNHVRKLDGIVPPEAMADEIKEILQSQKQTKN
ncbi:MULTISPECIES: hypothetical protein [Latilactobacillus]|nr:MULTISPECIES: hypothetical protein [Latilactobacillus]WCZ54964.1 hypothetical protein [Latilactobacillus phage TMW 1.1365 P1]WEU69631.1 hypothetical protein [Latilactobacillus phage TMW 1.1381 P1]MDT7016999.1 hypothetical protein [Latilactobacillus curvatus]UTB70143.1 hypothetical protein A4W71_03110 [Latilactobacillus curvatus]UTB71935.1 hypothetical protein A4W72_03195 [Latilactobacillus curvatus]